MKKGSVEVTNEFISNLSTRERVRRTRCFYARSLLLNAAKRTQMKQHELNESGAQQKARRWEGRIALFQMNKW
jgi:SAM-dependent MidA family methyltransferase